MEDNKYNITTLRMIRIVNDLNIAQMSKYFNISSKHEKDAENGIRPIYKTTFESGINNLMISMEQYNELEEFRKILVEKDLEDKEKFKYMLMKTIGVLSFEIKDQIDEVLDNILMAKTK